jgi:eukaryotic-like serine/threonine-protein kinase
MNSSLPPGARLGRYEVKFQLGAGGMGEVYLAEDTQLGRRVAIKILPPEAVSDEHARKRLVREARAAATLDHPNICSIHEVGEEGGRSFIAMQYVEGETLDVRMKGKPLELSESLVIAAQVADALAEAHAHSIIHRDIKPSNVIVDTRGQVKVMDFGLAKIVAGAIDGEAETHSLLTTPGALLGTVPYMSPEQVRGEVLDARSDIFSLGVVLYEILSGRQPFASESVTVSASAILTLEPPPLARFAPDTPDELQRIVQKCLEKDRKRRYQSARDLSIDLLNLQRHSDAGAITAEKSTVQPRSNLRRFFFRALPLAILAVISIAVYLLAIRGEAIDSIAVLPFVNVNADPDMEYLSDGVTESLINSLSQVPRLRMIARSSVFRYKGKDIDPQTVGRELGVRAILLGRVTQRGDNLSISAELVDARDNSRIWGEEYSRKLADILQVQEEISREISDKLRLKLTGEEQNLVAKHYTENVEAYRLYLKGRYYWNKRNEESLRRGVDYFQQAIDKDPHFALAYSGVADSYSVLGSVGVSAMPPKEAMVKTKLAAQKALQLDETLAEAHTSLADAKFKGDWDWSGAEREFKRALELKPNYAEAHEWYSQYLAAMGRFEESIAEGKRAQALDPVSPSISRNLGFVYYLARRYDQAIEEYQRALELDPNFFFAHWQLGRAYADKSMFEQAIAESQKAVELSGHGPGAVGGLGYVYAASGRRGETQQVLDELKELAKQRYVSPYSVAAIYARLGDKDAAFEWLEKAYREGAYGILFLKSVPEWDGWRSEPRFQDVMRRVGLPQ